MTWRFHPSASKLSCYCQTLCSTHVSQTYPFSTSMPGCKLHKPITRQRTAYTLRWCMRSQPSHRSGWQWSELAAGEIVLSHRCRAPRQTDISDKNLAWHCYARAFCETPVTELSVRLAYIAISGICCRKVKGLVSSSMAR